MSRVLVLILLFDLGGTSSLLAQSDKSASENSIEQVKDNVMPEATDRTLVNMSSYAGAETLADVAASFRDALQSKGYGGQGWSYIGSDPADTPREQSKPNPPALKQGAEVDGFILVTQIEQYDDQGKPLEGQKRLAVADVSDDATVTDKIKRILFGAPVGHYRMFLFAVDVHGQPQRQSTPSTYVQWQEFFLHQYRAPMLANFKKIDLSPGILSCTAFVYEFDRASTDGELVFRTSPRLPISQHLKGSGLMSALNFK